MTNKRSKNSGFTLIEIIGVIIIIGVILMISSTSVVKYIENSKIKTYESYREDLRVATDNFMIDCLINNEASCEMPKNGEDIVLTYEKLLELGYSKELKDPESDGYCDKSYVVAKNTGLGDSGFEYNVCLYCSNYEIAEEGCRFDQINDNTKPICDYQKLDGDNKEWTNQDVEVNIGCIDYGSGCVNETFKETFGKDNEVLQKGQIKIQDNKGNYNTCEVDVYLDKKKPTCELEVIGQSINGWYRDQVVVNIKNTNDVGSGVTNIGMGTSLNNRVYNGNTSYTFNQGGVGTIFGYVKDGATNSGYCNIDIKVDNTDPVGKIYMGYEIYPKENSIFNNTQVTINDLSKYGEISGIIIEFKENLTTSAKGDIYSNNVLIKESGSILSGRNQAIIKIESGEYDSITIDLENKQIVNQTKKIQVLKEETETTIWTNKDISIYVDANDTISGIDKYSYNNGQTYTIENIKSFSNNTTGKIVIKDKSGNVSNKYNYVINKIDKTAPTCELISTGTEGKNGWYTGDVKISFGNTKDDTSGVKAYGIGSLTGNKTEILNVDTIGKTYTGHVEDNAGNTNTCTTTVKRDTMKPTCELISEGPKGNNNWYIGDVSIFFSSTNDATSKVTTYGIGSLTGNKTEILNVDTIGKTYTGYVEDEAGNTNTCATTVKRDTTKSTCILTIDGKIGNAGWYTSDVLISLQIQNENDINEFGIDGFNNIKEIKLSTDTKSKVYTGYVKDNAGNISTCTTTVKRDTVKPTCELKSEGTTGNNGWYTEDVLITFNKTEDSTSGVKSYGIGSITGSKTDLLKVDSKGTTYTGYVEDEAGNTNTCTTTVKKDTTKPTCELISAGTEGKNGWYTSDVEISFGDTKDEVSGVKSYGIDSISGNQKEVLKTDTKSKTYTGYIEDNAGNTNTCPTTVKRDTTKPYANINEIKIKLDEVRVLQWDNEGNDLPDVYIKDRYCDTDKKECGATVCLDAKNGRFSLYNTPASFIDDTSGVSTSWYNTTMYDSKGNIPKDESCLRTRGDTPCKWVWQAEYYDYAGNSGEDFKFIYTIGYIGKNNEDGLNC